LYATTRQFLNDLSLTTLQELPMLDDASAQAESVAQRVMEFEGEVVAAVASPEGTSDVTDVADTSAPAIDAETDAADEQTNNEKTND
jgi:segregation and condensation protein B